VDGRTFLGDGLQLSPILISDGKSNDFHRQYPISPLARWRSIGMPCTNLRKQHRMIPAISYAPNNMVH
jgi:hypothetical protein